MNPSPCYIVVFLSFPGFGQVKVASGLIGRLIQETIDRALESNGLLLPALPLPPEMEASIQKSNEALRKIQATIPTMPNVPIVDADAIERLIGTPPVTFALNGDNLFLRFLVADPALALLVVESEIKRIGFLGMAEIGHYDTADNVCRTYYPKNSATRLAEHCLLVLKGAGLLPGQNPPLQNPPDR